jgi:DNA-binding NtrC family response regulator
MKVLLVEDDANLREGMAELISELATVREAGSIAEAQRALGEESYSLVLTDLRIGDTGGGGRLVLEAARKRLQPVGIVSASAAEEVARLLKPHLPDAVINKPFQLDDILRLVERFVRLWRELARQGAERRVPEESGWTEQGAAGVRRACSAEGARWWRLAPGASLVLSAEEMRSGMLVLEGSLEVEGERRERNQTFFLSAGPREVRSLEGCLAVSLTLGA